MKRVFQLALIVMAMLVAVGMFASCSPNNNEEETVTTTTQTTTTMATTTTQHGNLSASDVIVRSGPGLDFDAIGGVSYNEDIIILGREGDWYRIQFGDQVGYISAQYVDVDDAPNASEMVEGLKTTSTVKPADTTTKAGNTTVASKDGANNTTTKAGAATTTKAGNSTGTTTTATGAVTTTTVGEGLPIVDNIPEDVVIDDF